MDFKSLLSHWNGQQRAKATLHTLPVRLSDFDQSRLDALFELYPGQTKEALLGDLLSTALDQIEASFPYEQGSNVIAEDELGDPIFEDIGLTPKFIELTNHHYQHHQHHAQ